MTRLGRILGLAGFLMVGCGTPPAKDSYPCSGPVTLAAVQSTVFDHCFVPGAATGCHAQMPFGANLDLTAGHSAANLLHVLSQSDPSRFLVEPKDPDNSFLWQKVTGDINTGPVQQGLPMPRDANDAWAPLTHDQLTSVRCWILSGN